MKTTKTTTHKATKTAHTKLPVILRAIAHYADPEYLCVHEELADALAEARRIVADSNRRGDAIDAYVHKRAKANHPQALAMANEMDLGGDLQNAHATPAFYLGLSLAYVMLTADGAR